ncbi:Hypothetical protein FKW44_006221, partial [Caligus rogercresseyi]
MVLWSNRCGFKAIGLIIMAVFLLLFVVLQGRVFDTKVPFKAAEYSKKSSSNLEEEEVGLLQLEGLKGVPGKMRLGGREASAAKEAAEEVGRGESEDEAAAGAARLARGRPLMLL